MKNLDKLAMGILMSLSLAGSAQAAVVEVNSDIATSTTWTADNTYKLTKQIYVLPGASLTIEAGTVVASDPADLGSLAVTRGAKIFVNGTKEEPVIMTSTADVATWAADASHPTGKDPKTGTWREAANEWGNLTIMGNGLISASDFDGLPVGDNTKTPTGANEKQMEGLVAANAGDTKVFYGGADDNDDSGSISYLSLRYAGKVVGLGNELNGLSLGAIGRETEINHVEIMNNVDDGIEIWGGTVELKYVSIWNVGDDSFDIDQGWRGKAQFGFIVQGYSIDDSQGSGVGDNAIEHDGAEDSDAQPVTTATLYNFTVIGQPVDGDGGTAWRDGARVQHRNAIFMDLGEKLVRPDGDDGDGANGYGFNGTLSFADVWTTDYDYSLSAPPVNGCETIAGGCSDFNTPAALYQSQVDGKLAEISNSVFFRNLNSAAYTDSDLYGVTVAGGSNPAVNNVVIPGSADADAPIKAISRAGAVTKGGKTMLRVTSVDPRAANEAASTDITAPADGFFTPAPYIGAFSPTNNWLAGWTAADAFGMTDTSGNPSDPSELTIQLTASLLFDTVAGVTYTVEGSNDGTAWYPVGTVLGDGTVKSVTDLADFDNAKIYRVSAQ